MDFGPHTLHIFVSLMVVLAAAGVALVCDLLKGNNDHLRELAVELKVRKEEAERRVQAMEKMEKKGKRLPNPALPKPAMAAAPVTPPSAQPEEVAVPSEVPAPKIAASAAETTTRTSRPDRPRRQMSPAVAAIAQAASAIVNNNKENEPAFAAASASSQEAVETQTASNIRRKNWDSILKKTAGPRQQGALIPFESIREAVPAGFHDASVLQRAVESGRTLSGVVVSIGTNPLSAEAAAEVVEFLQGQLTGLDFACQSGSDEYIMICAGEQGAAAQRRLSSIAEHLWDFQLSSIGGSGVQFSWGSSEARGERIGEAVATAIEQMQDTRQLRRVNIAKAV